RDRRENLDPQALQQQGESALGLVTSLARTDFATLKSGDDIYFDVLGLWLPRLPKDWALPLSLLAFLGIGVAEWRRRAAWRAPSKRLLGFLMPPLLLAGVIGAGFLLHWIAARISGHPDPSFAHPWALRLALFFGVWSVALLAAWLEASVGDAWLWISGLGVAAAVLAPGLSPYFLFPSLIAALLLVVTARMGNGAWRFAAWIGALACALTWLDLAASGEAIMGLAAHPLFTVSAGFALIALLPLMNRKGVGFSMPVSAGLALVFAVIAGFLPAFSPASPERLNLHYVERDGHANWIADTMMRLPEALAHAGNFSRVSALPLFGRGYQADASAVENAPPDATVSSSGGHLTVTLHGSAQADGMMVIFPTPLTLESVNDRPFANMPPLTRMGCDTPDCADARMTFAGKPPASFDVVEIRRGLPAKGNALLAARPDTAVPSGAGDQTFLVRHITVPGG
ncbi:MAG TPA: hypothetical protein VHX92_07495, partial [Rhizomicrobium sp.]|nr:hypothetical protein [Rhizomicrobium sp.]